MATLVVGLLSGTVGLAGFLKDMDLWLALVVAMLCGFAGGYAKGAGAALWARTSAWWSARRERMNKEQ